MTKSFTASNREIQSQHKPLKVCHIAATAEGATWMVEQLRELRDRHGYEVSAIVSPFEGGLINKLRAENIPFHQINLRGQVTQMWYLLPIRIFQLAKLLRREQFDVVQTHLFYSMMIGRFASWFADVPVRLAMLAAPYHLEANTTKWVDGATCWMETALIPSCELTRHLYLEMGVSPNRLFLVYYGTDERKFNPEVTAPASIRREYGWPDDTPLVGMIAYFYPPRRPRTWIPVRLHNLANKRHEDLIAAAPLILQEFPNAKFLFVGSGWGLEGNQLMDRIKEQIRAAGLQDTIIFTGFRKDVNNILVDLDVAVQASLSENLGGTIESLLMVCPTVATRVGGMVDSIRDGETGILVEPLNSDELAEGILKLLRDPEEANVLAKNGRAWMLERFTLSRTVADLDQIYQQLNTSHAVGYRWWKTLWRLVISIPVFAYLGVRLLLDVLVLDRLNRSEKRQ